MRESDLIDESANVPTIERHRLNMIDFMAALESSDPDGQILDTWGFTEEERKILERYVEDNRDDLVEIMEENTPPRP